MKPNQSIRTRLLSLLLLASTCAAAIYPTRFDNVTWDDFNWRLTTTYADVGHYQSRGSLANGYFGISVSALGPFFEVDTPVDGDVSNGWPLFQRRQSFGTVAGFYDVQAKTNSTNYGWLDQYGGESVISGLPHWSGLHVQTGSSTLDSKTPLDEITGFSSTLDMGAGVLSWRFTWTPPDGPPMDVEYDLFVHKLYINQACTQIRVTPSRDANVTIVDVLNGDGAVRTNFVEKGMENNTATMYTAVQPFNIPNVTAYVYSTMVGDGTVDLSSRMAVHMENLIGANASSIAQSVSAQMRAGQTSTIRKHVGVASSDGYDSPQRVARSASIVGSQTSYSDVLRPHMEEWKSIMPRESVDQFNLPDGSLPADPNIVELNVQAVAMPFQLLQNTVGLNALKVANNDRAIDDNSISVGGLYSDSYAGLVFWDADVWMAPGLAVSFPHAAAQISNYRAAKYQQALRNIEAPSGAPASSKANTSFTPDAAAFPWTSGRFGNCTGTGPCFDYQYHLNGDIALAIKNYYVASGDISRFRSLYWPIYNSVAQLYSNLLYYSNATQTYGLRNATDPDEYANNINQPGYTLALIKVILSSANQFRKFLGMPSVNLWQDQSDGIVLPVNERANIIVEYAGMNGSAAVKQADIVLIDDFLYYQNPHTLSNLDYYASKQDINGPAMTFGVFAIVASLNSPSGCAAYTYDLYGSQPYTRAPFFQFSEQVTDSYTDNGGTHPAYPFLTGVGGALRVPLFGYLGLRLVPGTLNVNPSLPPQIPNVRYRTFFWQGHGIKAVSNATHTMMTRLPRSMGLTTADPTYDDTSIPVTIGDEAGVTQFQPNSTMVLPNRMPGLNKTIAGNAAQCRPALSTESYLPGQFPLAAVDGSASTKWQPASPDMPSTLTVDLGEDNAAMQVSGFAFDWAQSPPMSFSVSFSNATDGSGSKMAYSTTNVRVSNPYDATMVDVITSYQSNSTNVTLDSPMLGGRYAMLVVQGSKNGDGNGCQVGEFAVLGMDGAVMENGPQARRTTRSSRMRYRTE